MIEKKTLWAVTRELEIKQKTAIMEDGKLLAAKNPDAEDREYDGSEYIVIKYFDTEEEAKTWIADEERYIREAYDLSAKQTTNFKQRNNDKRNSSIANVCL